MRRLIRFKLFQDSFKHDLFFSAKIKLYLISGFVI